MSVQDAREELARIEERAALLRLYITLGEETARRAAYRTRWSGPGTGEPCSWCGNRAHTVADHREGAPSGLFICRWPGPCRLAWMCGVSPEDYRKRLDAPA